MFQYSLVSLRLKQRAIKSDTSMAGGALFQLSILYWLGFHIFMTHKLNIKHFYSNKF